MLLWILFVLSLSIPSVFASLLKDFLAGPSASFEYVPFDSSYKLVWSDEFTQQDGTPPDPAIWNYVIGPDTSGNQQVQYFTNRINNSFIQDERLIIQALQENYEGKNYTSASLNTKGKVQIMYGLIGIRARIRMFDGAWPAVSMQGMNPAGFPRSGYADIFEQINGRGSGVLNDSIQFATLHYNVAGENSTTVQHQQVGGNITTKPNQYWGDEFHLYQALWTNSSYSFLLDDLVYLTIDLTSAIGYNSYLDPSNPFFFIVNFALGGDWPGKNPDPKAFPARLEIDWIRVWQQPNTNSYVKLESHNSKYVKEED